MRIVIFGGTGHVGTAAASGLADQELIFASRSNGVDLANESSVREFLANTAFDAVVVCVGATPFKHLTELEAADYVSAFASKVLAQINVARIACEYLPDHGSITLTTGILARSVIANGATAAMANGALESWVRAASRELPRQIRINAVSPTVLESAPAYFDAFPGFIPASDEVVGAAFRRSVLGIETGQVFEIN